MKRLALILAGVIFGLSINSAALAAEKFGYVSIAKMSNDYLKAKQYMKDLEKIEIKFSDQIEKKRDEVKKFQDKLNMMSEKQREAKKGELEDKIKDFQEFVLEKERDLRKEDADKAIELSKEMMDAIEKYSKKEGYALVFEVSALAYQPKSMDITDEIVDILNKAYKR